jgi:hypothetical protein
MPVSAALGRQFDALLNRVEDALAPTPTSATSTYVEYELDAGHIRPLFERWSKVREALMENDDEFAYMSSPPTFKVDADGSYHNRGSVRRNYVERLRDDMRDFADVLRHPSKAGQQLSLDREGIFTAGQPFDAMLAITSILRAAKTSILVVDGYIDDKTLNLLTVKGVGVAARIITGPKAKLTPPFLQSAAAFVAQYNALEIRVSKTFHDRFVVIDDADYYHFGATLKDAGKNTFMFSRIEEPAVVTALKAEIAKEWTNGTVVQF